MMHGLVMDRKAPLYGRAREIVKIEPLSAGWLMPALGLGAAEAVKAYATWGGVPPYWELAAEYPNQEAALADLVWSPRGVLHEEPGRLLLDDLRSAVQPYSILSLIGAGCPRPSEVAARMEKPLSSLARPLAQLCDLGYIRRDVPFGENRKRTRHALYRLKTIREIGVSPKNKVLYTWEAGGMARLARVSYAGAIYHVTVRRSGDIGKAYLFDDDQDRERWVERLAERMEPFDVRLYAFSLMRTHLHMVLETPRANVSAFVQSLNTAYAAYDNRRHHRRGHLSAGRFSAKLVEGDAYLLSLTVAGGGFVAAVSACGADTAAGRVGTGDGQRGFSWRSDRETEAVAQAGSSPAPATGAGRTHALHNRARSRIIKRYPCG